MRTIHRYTLPITDRPVIDMPATARVLPAPPCVRSRDSIEIWAEVDTDEPKAPRHFWIIGTGNPMPPDDQLRRFIGTVITHSGNYVWHLYEALR